jgi:hypothetical protein
MTNDKIKTQIANNIIFTPSYNTEYLNQYGHERISDLISDTYRDKISIMSRYSDDLVDRFSYCSSFNSDKISETDEYNIHSPRLDSINPDYQQPIIPNDIYRRDKYMQFIVDQNTYLHNLKYQIEFNKIIFNFKL